MPIGGQILQTSRFGKVPKPTCWPKLVDSAKRRGLKINHSDRRRFCEVCALAVDTRRKPAAAEEKTLTCGTFLQMSTAESLKKPILQAGSVSPGPFSLISSKAKTLDSICLVIRIDICRSTSNFFAGPPQATTSSASSQARRCSHGNQGIC